MAKRIIVTGGGGFIGSHLCRKLVSQGHHVTCVDNFFSGSEENLKDLVENPNFKIIKHDIVKPLDLEGDQIYHLACPASPTYYQHDPIWTMETVVVGTLNMLRMAQKCGATFLSTSTSEIYGDPTVHPQVEEYTGNVNTLGRRACYDEGKRAAEALCMDFHRFHNLDTKIARIFNTYGPSMQFNDGRVVSNMVVQALKGNALPIYGNGKQTRSFCYVDDMVDGLIKLMASDTHEPVNLGNPNEFTMLELAELIGKIMGQKIEYEWRVLPQDDPQKRNPDITRAKRQLGWEPTVPLETGLAKLIEDFRTRGMDHKLELAHQKEAVLASDPRKS